MKRRAGDPPPPPAERNNWLPDDLLTIRCAEERTGVKTGTIRNWISAGKGARKLPTFRRPDEAERLLVSERHVRDFRDLTTTRKAKRKNDNGEPIGRIVLTLSEDDSAHVRTLAVAMENRLDVRMTYVDVVRLAVSRAIVFENTHKPEPSE